MSIGSESGELGAVDGGSLGGVESRSCSSMSNVGSSVATVGAAEPKYWSSISKSEVGSAGETMTGVWAKLLVDEDGSLSRSEMGKP